MRLKSRLRTRLCLGQVREAGDLFSYGSSSCSVLKAFGFKPIPQNSSYRLLIVGGGFAGAAAAREAHELGIDVTLLEARRRFGGRARSKIIGENSLVEDGPQFVGLNHHLVRFYAHLCRMHFSPLTEYDGPISPVLPAANVLSAVQAAKAIEVLLELAPAINRDARSINIDSPTESPRFAEFDRLSMADWLQSAISDDVARRVFETQIVANHGVPLSEFSYAAFLLLIAAHGVEQYWELTEELVLQEGTQILVERLLEPIGERALTSSAVKDIHLESDNVAVTTHDGRRFEADDLILTVPSSTWEHITFSPAEVGRTLQFNRPGFGANIKFIFPLRRGARFQAGLSSIAVMENANLQLIWRTTEGQKSDLEVLTAFSGGPAAERLLAMNNESLQASVLAELTRLFPNFSECLLPAANGKLAPRLVRWPENPFTRGGYSCPRSGDLTKRLILENVHPRLHLAGEHMAAQWAFMNGACETGIYAVAKILTERRLSVPELEKCA